MSDCDVGRDTKLFQNPQGRKRCSYDRGLRDFGRCVIPASIQLCSLIKPLHKIKAATQSTTVNMRRRPLTGKEKSDPRLRCASVKENSGNGVDRCSCSSFDLLFQLLQTIRQTRRALS